VRLDKRVPVAAGLGGGSTDAAAVLLGLNQMWGLRWSVRRLASVAETLGMDVPFFLRGGRALATGRGERLTPVRGGALALVLVNPRLGVSASEAYARVPASAYSDGDRARDMVTALASRRPVRVAAALHNALEAPVASTVPQIAQMKAALMAAGALGTVMSGSGPTVLGVARSFEHARQIRARLTRVSWACWAVRTVGGPAVRVERRH
jgi:4-diphosphocytidyl-2-C-methyl-D-erythritol kinase